MRSLMTFLFSFLLVIFLVGCQQPSLEPSEGFIEVPGGAVWYRVVGSGTGVPVL